MIYIDQILSNNLIDEAEERLSVRDFRILKSLCKLVSSSEFITENQGKLLIKILRANNDQIGIESNVLEFPLWSKPFRVVDMIKKVYIDNKDDPCIAIEFSFSSQIKKTISDLAKNLDNVRSHGKYVYADLTEMNIVNIVSTLSSFNFEIDSTIQNYYDTITAWDRNTYIDQYRIDTIQQHNFQKVISQDLGISTPLTKNLIADRSIRYQYYVDRIEPTTLTEYVANRVRSKIWIDSQKYTLTDVISTLIELKRLPLLVVFDVRDPKKNLIELDDLYTALNNNSVEENVGIYFRLSNSDPSGKDFNQRISDYKYNQVLTAESNVVGVHATKLPKFMLKNDWKPMSVLSINNSLRHSKTAIYANSCDLIMSYTASEPIIETRTMWE